MLFVDKLETYNITKEKYLNKAKEYAKTHNYNPNNLSFSLNPKYKLTYKIDNKNISFGSPENMDFIIYKNLEMQNLITKGEAKKHRKNYLLRASKILGEWSKNKYSKNNLAMSILWDA